MAGPLVAIVVRVAASYAVRAGSVASQRYLVRRGVLRSVRGDWITLFHRSATGGNLRLGAAADERTILGAIVRAQPVESVKGFLIDSAEDWAVATIIQAIVGREEVDAEATGATAARDAVMAARADARSLALAELLKAGWAFTDETSPYETGRYLGGWALAFAAAGIQNRTAGQPPEQGELAEKLEQAYRARAARLREEQRRRGLRQSPLADEAEELADKLANPFLNLDAVDVDPATGRLVLTFSGQQTRGTASVTMGDTWTEARLSNLLYYAGDVEDRLGFAGRIEAAAIDRGGAAASAAYLERVQRAADEGVAAQSGGGG